MIMKYSDYLIYEVPDTWKVSENEDTISIYDNDGVGAITVSFYKILELNGNLVEHIGIMASKIIDQSHIQLKGCLISDITQEGKKTVYATGKTEDGWFIKLWVIAKYPKAVVVTYNAPKKTNELKTVNSIIESFRFENL